MTVRHLEVPDHNKTFFSTTQAAPPFLNPARRGSSRSLVAVVTKATRQSCDMASPQRCHCVAQLMYDPAEQQGDEEVGQLTAGDVDTRNLKTNRNDNNRLRNQAR